jgi:Fe-S oxidoreductase
MVVEEEGAPAPVRAALELWSRPKAADLAMRAASIGGGLLRDGQFTRLGRTGAGVIPQVHRMIGWRTPPAVPRHPARDRLRDRLRYAGPPLETPARGIRVAYFIQCITDRFFPRMALSVARLMDACGVEMVVPQEQHCCGLPALDAGALEPARKMARQTIETLEHAEVDYIITGGASCAIAMLHDYDRLFSGEPQWQERARGLSERVLDFTTFMDSVVRLQPGALAHRHSPFAPVTYHNFCQSANVLGLHDAPRRLIAEVMGLELREMEESSVCCGFGGSTSVTRPEVAEHILERKLQNVLRTGARSRRLWPHILGRGSRRGGQEVEGIREREPGYKTCKADYVRCVRMEEAIRWWS